jgi:hypothetical protein
MNKELRDKNRDAVKDFLKYREIKRMEAEEPDVMEIAEIVDFKDDMVNVKDLYKITSTDANY